MQEKEHQNNYNVHVCLMLHTKTYTIQNIKKKEKQKQPKIHTKTGPCKKRLRIKYLRVFLEFVDCSHCLRNTKCASARAPKQLQCACILDCPHRKITFQ